MMTNILSVRTNIKFSVCVLSLTVLFCWIMTACENPQEKAKLEQLEHINSSIEAAFNYLKTTQEKDGSWPYYSAKDRAFTKQFSLEQPRIGGNMKLCMALLNTDFAQTATFEKGLNYILDNKQEEAHLWAYDGKKHEYSKDRVKANEVLTGEPLDYENLPLLEPDTDGTSVALILLGEKMKLTEKDYQTSKALYDAYLDENGLYKTFLDNYYGEQGWRVYDYATKPSIGVNLTILGFFDKYKLPSSNLVKAFNQYLTDKNYWKKPDYYTSLPILANMATDNVELGSSQSFVYLERFLTDYEANFKFKNWPKQVTTELAAYIRAKSFWCIKKKEKGALLADAVAELRKRQTVKGGWKAAGMYEAGYFPDVKGHEWQHHEFYGSPAETTAMSIKALWTYRQMLKEKK